MLHLEATLTKTVLLNTIVSIDGIPLSFRIEVYRKSDGRYTTMLYQYNGIVFTPAGMNEEVTEGTWTGDPLFKYGQIDAASEDEAINECVARLNKQIFNIEPDPL